MWPLLLKILTIIGIVLLSVLGLLLFILIVVLFAPIRYKIFGEAKEDNYSGGASFSYICGLLNGSFMYPSPGKLRVRIAFFTIYEQGKEKKEKKHKKDKNDGTNIKESKDSKDTIQSTECKESLEDGYGESVKNSSNSSNTEENKEAESNVETTAETEAETEASTENATESKTENATESETETKAETKKASKKKSRTKTKKKKEHTSLTYKIRKFRYTILHTYDKIKLKYKDISFWKRLWENEDTQAFVQRSKKQMAYLLKLLLPRKARMNVSYCAGSPDYTAYIYGLFSLKSSKWGKKAVLIPDFEGQKAYAVGYLRVWGHFNLFCILWQAFLFWFGKKFRLLKARIKKHKLRMTKAKENMEKNHEQDEKDLNASAVKERDTTDG